MDCGLDCCALLWTERYYIGAQISYRPTAHIRPKLNPTWRNAWRFQAHATGLQPYKIKLYIDDRGPIGPTPSTEALLARWPANEASTQR